MWTLTEYLSLKPFLHIWQWCINFDLFSNLWGDGDEIGDNLMLGVVKLSCLTTRNRFFKEVKTVGVIKGFEQKAILLLISMKSFDESSGFLSFSINSLHFNQQSCPDFIFLLFPSCCLNELITMAVGVSESTLVLAAAAVATVVKAFLRKENEVTDEFPLSEVSFPSRKIVCCAEFSVICEF